jgi:serine/threonine protein kinase
MTSTWTNEEIEHILIQLDMQNVPFKKFSLSKQGDGLELLGTGGYSRVYKAVSNGLLKNDCAIKVIGFGDKRVDSETFRNAAESQKELSQFQDYVVKLFDYKEIRVWVDENNNVLETRALDDIGAGKSEGNYIDLQFVVMEQLKPVLAIDKAGRPVVFPEELASFDENEIHKLAYHIGMALERAHKKNLLHRDVKLENIFYDEKKKQYKLGDFGIAKLTDDGMASTVAFTKGYGAPEVVGALDEKYDNTADIYSFGMLLYILSNGMCFPDSANYNVNIRYQYSQGYVLPFPEHASEKFYEVLLKMCSFNPDDRQQSMTDVLTDLDSIVVNEGLKYKREHMKATFVMAVLMLFLGAFVWKATFPQFSPDFTDFDLTISISVVLGISLYKGFRKLRKKETYILSYVLLGFMIFIMFKYGFAWWKLVLALCLTFSSGTFSSLCAGIMLLFIGMDNLRVLGYGVDLWAIGDYRWLAITFISLSAVLFLQYFVLEERDLKNDKVIFKGNMYWILMMLLYLSLLISDWSFHSRGSWLLEKLIGSGTTEYIRNIGVSKIGIFGAVFCFIWIVREKLLIKLEKQ